MFPILRASASALVLIALSGATGCNRVSGTVDGEKVPSLRGFFIEDQVFDDGDGLIVVFLSNLADPCQVEADLLEDLNDAQSAAEAENAWADHMPQEFWDLRIYMRVSDLDEELSGEELRGVPWDEDMHDDGDAYVSFSHYTDLLDEDWFDGLADSSDYRDHYFSDDGFLQVDRHAPGVRISGAFEAEVADSDDGDPRGSVTVHFNVERCPDAEREYFD